MYIYELIVFTFISPFVVAFSITTGQSRKIVDFLVTALTLFLKPVIITISIYLSLFLYSLFTDVFMLTSYEQFQLSLITSDSFWSELTLYFVKELLYIFAILASVYILWKVILSLPDFIFRMIGLDKLDNTSQFASDMQQKFSKYGFQA